MEFAHEEKTDPRQKRTRQLILDAFMALMREKPFDNITVQDITERATINRATFYDHFDDKFALTEYALKVGFRQTLMRSRLDDAPCTDQNLALLISATCEFLLEFRGRCSPANNDFNSRFEIQIIEQLNEILLHWLSQESGQDRWLDMRASVTSWAIYGAAVHWKKVHRQMALEEYVQQVIPIIVEGMNAHSLKTKT